MYDNSEAQMEHDEQRMAWRRAQPEHVIRSLASDYLRGSVDECTTDAYHEYQDRFGKKPNKAGRPNTKTSGRRMTRRA